MNLVTHIRGLHQHFIDRCIHSHPHLMPGAPEGQFKNLSPSLSIRPPFEQWIYPSAVNDPLTAPNLYVIGCCCDQFTNAGHSVRASMPERKQIGGLAEALCISIQGLNELSICLQATRACRLGSPQDHIEILRPSRLYCSHCLDCCLGAWILRNFHLTSLMSVIGNLTWLL